MLNRSPICRTIDPVSPEPVAIQEAVRLLSSGELVAYPTDTLYGLGIDPRRPAAIEQLFEVKGRAAQVGIPLIAANTDQVEIYAGRLSSLGERLAETFWPGPLTLVIAARPALDRRLLGGRASVAVRVPDHAIARRLAAGLGHPITATSANLSGRPAAQTAIEAVSSLRSEVAMVIDGGLTIGGLPSTIVDSRGTTPLLLRAGVVPWDRVLQSLK